MEKNKYWVWLSLIKDLGSRKKQKLLEIYKTPENIYKLNKKEFIKEKAIAKEKGIKLQRPKAKEQYHEIKQMLIERQIPYNSKLMQQMQRNFRSQGVQNANKRANGTRVGDWKYRNSRNYNGITITTTKEQYTLFVSEEFKEVKKHRNNFLNKSVAFKRFFGMSNGTLNEAKKGMKTYKNLSKSIT